MTAAAIAFMMAVAMSQAGPAGRVLHLLLSRRFFKPLADLSYSAYLYHEQASYTVHVYLFPVPLVNCMSGPISR